METATRTLTKEYISERFKNLQDHICASLEQADGLAMFEEENWKRPGGGGGRTRVIQNGNILAKGGVNFSAVNGLLPENIAKALKIPVGQFFATGVSIVLHPISPMVPIIHMNVRYFEVGEDHRWFGGGIDLTPHYIDKADAKYFHQKLKDVCDKHNPAYYPAYKTWADDYFYLKHRQETRGVGGIFFDRLSPNENTSLEDLHSFVMDVGMAFAPTYTHLMAKNASLPYSEAQLAWQALRRSRYVEFNLLYDKGTKFGLDTDGRTESILMSMPPMAQWAYNYTPQPGTPEHMTQALLKKDIHWVNIL